MMTLLSFKGLIGGIGKVVVSGLAIIGGVEVFKWVSKGQNSNTNNKGHVVPPIQSTPNETFTPSKAEDNRLSVFPLSNIQSLFSRCNVKTSDAGAFQKLLSQIEHISYKDTLKKVLDSGQTPVMLYECVTNLKAEEYKMGIYTYDSGPYVEDSIIDDLLKKRFSDNLQDRTLSEKVELLVNYSLTKGYNSYINLFGEHLREFKSYYELGLEDKYVPLYDSIIEGIRTSYNIATNQ